MRSSPLLITDPVLSELRNQLNFARGFGARYDAALRSFQRSDAIGKLISDKALDYFEDRFDLDRDSLDQAAASFFSQWKHSQPHRQLETEVEQVIQNAKTTLLRAYRSPPVFTEIHEAIRLSTKMARLATVLAKAVDDVERWLASGKPLPVRRSRGRISSQTSPHKRARARANAQSPSLRDLLPKTWWEWLGILIAFVALAVYLPQLLRINELTAIILSVVIVWILVGIDMVTRRYQS